MSRLTTMRRGGVRTLVALSSLVWLGCQPSAFPGEKITSTPVATPIVVVASTPATKSPTPNSSSAPDERQDEVRALITRARESFPGHSAVVFVDLGSGTRVEFEATTSFESASLAKLLVLAELYRQFEVGIHQPEEKLTLLESQKREGSGRLKAAKEGTQYTLEHLAHLMITESDNTATQMLTDLLGLESIERGAQTMGLLETTFQRDIFDFDAIDQGRDNIITAKDAANFFQQLARLELPGAEPMADILEQQKRNDMIGHDFPPDIRVAHKTGELNGILNDAGIIYAPRGAFILVALSDRVVDKEAAKETWAKLALDLLELYSEPPAASATPPLADPLP